LAGNAAQTPKAGAVYPRAIWLPAIWNSLVGE
jgi:hypothetical protein